jgi:hypothetical protein
VAARVTIKRSESEAFRLPPFCALCGEQEYRVVELRLPYSTSAPIAPNADPHVAAIAVHVGVGASFFFLGAVYALVRNVCMTRRATVFLPLCDRHARTAARRAWLLPAGMWLLFVLVAPLMIYAGVETVHLIERGAHKDDYLPSIFTFMAAFLCAAGAMLVRARLHEGFIYAVRATDDEVVLDGVSREFSHAVASGEDNGEVVFNGVSPPFSRAVVPGEDQASLASASDEFCPAADRARLLNQLGTLSLLLSFGTVTAGCGCLILSLDKSPMPFAVLCGTALLTVAFLLLPLAVWLVARRDLGRMRYEQADDDENASDDALREGLFATRRDLIRQRRRVVDPPGASRTEVAMLQGRFATVAAFIGAACAVLAVLIAWQRQ